MRSYSYLNCFSKIRANVDFGLNLLLLEAPSKLACIPEEISTVSQNCASIPKSACKIIFFKDFISNFLIVFLIKYFTLSLFFDNLYLSLVWCSLVF